MFTLVNHEFSTEYSKNKSLVDLTTGSVKINNFYFNPGTVEPIKLK
jgi:hypothetical protein